MTIEVEIDPIVRNKARSVGADSWLAALPELIASLERDWKITVGRGLSGGTEAYVTEATMADGRAAVLKLCVPMRENAGRDEITFLSLADGHGCAALYEADVERDALLVERLGPSLADLALPLERIHDVICATVSQLWRPVPETTFRSGADKGRWLVDYVLERWEDLDRPCDERAVAYAVECAERRIADHDHERAVLCHGDAHQWNTLQTLDGGGYRLIDPDGLVAEPAYDLAIPMREDPDGDLHERARRLAARTGVDATAIWEWGAIERVSTGLLCVAIELEPIGTDMLRGAERAAMAPWPGS